MHHHALLRHRAREPEGAGLSFLWRRPLGTGRFALRNGLRQAVERPISFRFSDCRETPAVTGHRQPSRAETTAK